MNEPKSSEFEKVKEEISWATFVLSIIVCDATGRWSPMLLLLSLSITRWVLKEMFKVHESKQSEIKQTKTP